MSFHRLNGGFEVKLGKIGIRDIVYLVNNNGYKSILNDVFTENVTCRKYYKCKKLIISEVYICLFDILFIKFQSIENHMDLIILLL